MTNQRIHALALMTGMLAGIVTMSIHPTGIDLHASAAAITRINHINIATHVLGLASIPVTVLGVFGISSRIGWKNIHGLSAFIIYCFAAIAVMLAAVADGLIGPSLVQEAVKLDDSQRQILMMALHYNFQLNQALAKVYVAASSCAFILWSIALVHLGKPTRNLGIAGGVVGLCSLIVLLSGHIQMSAHGFGLIILAQAIWTILVAIALFREQPEPVAE
ncbi:hypothetical protein LT85_1312 [Collimonas arenae]|uniref:DUF4386 family protein n=1 Tax=Collimonas arenae TaxID=279058 RepID=A0A0A1F9L2_9BURK|nr:hypothetical protein [Collimonas arenae]AIY40470.1 hypothetical protein LT85_1312 [Collimonas arenae]